MTDLEFSIAIAAPAARVWDCMFDPLTYRDWTRAFAEGSYFEGSWLAGQRLRFLDPRGFGMEAVVDENRLHQVVALRLVGEIKDGQPLADSRLHREPAHERYVFNTTPAGGTLLVVHLQGWDGFLDFLKATWPLALQRLKALAESTHLKIITMHKQIFVNLPCKNLPASKAFFEALGYSFNPQFTSDAGAGLVLGDNLYAMLLTEEFAKGFTAKPLVDAKTATEVLVCLSCDSREQVDQLVAKASAAGGTVPRSPVDHGFMYGHGFEDLDGHIWELVYMSGTPPQT